MWNRPTTGLFDYHYDVAGLYYQVMLILILMLILMLILILILILMLILPLSR